jgi:enamine deaminase RidA (YjgF/YER057c/UK114 family)
VWADQAASLLPFRCHCLAWSRRSARAHGEAFAEIRPAATMVQVAALAEPEMMVEIEAVAVIGSRA